MSMGVIPDQGVRRSASRDEFDAEEDDLETLIGETGTGDAHFIMPVRKPPSLELSPVMVPHPPSPPLTERDGAATTLQKVYRGYRTRRNLADCAVMVEELWWKALDFAVLKRSSVSFFDGEKSESAVSKWSRARARAAKVGKGLSKDEKARKLALQHWLEAIDPRHRYGHNLHLYYDAWSESKSSQPFFYWLDVGDGKDINLEICCRAVLNHQFIKYLGPMEREEYEVTVESGKLVYRQGGILVTTAADSKWIFVLSTSRALYVGRKKKGCFQHSSFLSGGATTAAGRLIAHGGVLEAIWPYSGHYLPTEDNFNEFIGFLEEKGVELTNVKRCGVDDDETSINSREAKPEEAQVLLSDQREDNDDSAIEEDEAPILHTQRRLSRKWTSAAGARIGCLKDYPAEIQRRALELMNLSPPKLPPKLPPPRQSQGCLPIPPPRPSPSVRASPRVAFMGHPSPRISLRSDGGFQ